MAMAAKFTDVFILLLAITSSFAVNATQPPSSTLTCTKELVMFSPCLPYVSAPPNNISETPNPICCSVFSSSIHSGAGNCLCYLLRQPTILGFPLDKSRLLSLSQICTDSSSHVSFELLCSPSESPELPPLQSIQFTNPIVSGHRDSASHQSVGLAPETDVISPGSGQFSPETATVSPPAPQYITDGSPKIKNLWFIWTLIMTLATSILTEQVVLTA